MHSDSSEAEPVIICCCRDVSIDGGVLDCQKVVHKKRRYDTLKFRDSQQLKDDCRDQDYRKLFVCDMHYKRHLRLREPTKPHQKQSRRGRKSQSIPLAALPPSPPLASPTPTTQPEVPQRQLRKRRQPNPKYNNDDYNEDVKNPNLKTQQRQQEHQQLHRQLRHQHQQQQRNQKLLAASQEDYEVDQHEQLPIQEEDPIANLEEREEHALLWYAEQEDDEDDQREQIQFKAKERATNPLEGNEAFCWPGTEISDTVCSVFKQEESVREAFEAEEKAREEFEVEEKGREEESGYFFRRQTHQHCVDWQRLQMLQTNQQQQQPQTQHLQRLHGLQQQLLEKQTLLQQQLQQQHTQLEQQQKLLEERQRQAEQLGFFFTE